MPKLTFNEKQCKGCALCVTACPKKIIKISDKTNLNGYFVAECSDESKCIACTACAAMCPDAVIEIEN